MRYRWLLPLFLLAACASDVTAPEPARSTVAPPWWIMPGLPKPPAGYVPRPRPRSQPGSSSGVQAQLKGSGYTPTMATVCDQVKGPGQTAKIDLCFGQFAVALGMTLTAAGKCSGKALAGGPNAASVTSRWGACILTSAGVVPAWYVWVDYSNVDGWYDWTTREFQYRMWEAAFARIQARKDGKTVEP